VRVNPPLRHGGERVISLDGEWSFRLDPDDEGVRGCWFNEPQLLDKTIRVPGCWQGQGFGGDGKETLRDFKLEARVFRATYTGTGWYGKRFDAPAEWRDGRVWLRFGGVHPSADVWLNGARLGGNDLPFVPFGFEVTELVRRDRSNFLAVRVHEKHREFALAFNWQGNWSGLYRSVELAQTGPSYIERCEILPDVDAQVMRFGLRIGDPAAGRSPLTVRVACRPVEAGGSLLEMEAPVTGEALEFELPVPSPHLWSPDAPNLYRVDVALTRGDELLDAVSERTGFVKLSADGNRFLINGEPHYMRGTGDFISCPETGCPDTDRDRWRRKLKTLREYGYNYVRCQSYVYPSEYFDVADEVGLLVQSEMGVLGAWGGHSHWHVYQWPAPTPDNYPLLKRQWDLVVRRDVNHPSANIYCMSNELFQQNQRTPFPRIAWRCYRDTKAIKPTAFVIWTDGGYNPELPGDFVNEFVTHIDYDLGVCNKEAAEYRDKPVIEHEFRWWSAFPDVRVMDKYSGAVRPYAAEIAREAARRWGLDQLLAEAAEMSRRLQFVEMKGKMEACRRDHPHLAGICHFSAMDTNPSPQGVVDEFYEHKYADAELWLQTNGDTIVLSSLGFDDRVRAGGGEFVCRFSVSDFSHPPFEHPTVEWKLVVGDRTAASGELAYAHRPYCTCPAGEIRLALPTVSKPTVARLEGRLREGGRTASNRWDLWIMPPEAPLPNEAAVYGAPRHSWLKGLSGVGVVTAEDLAGNAPVRAVLTEVLDDHLARFMRAGGRVVLAATEGMVRPHPPNFGYVKYFFTPPANYPPYEDGQNGTIIRDHPMLGGMPHEGFADLGFFRLIEDAPPLDLAPLGLHPGEVVIRVIHRYPVFRPLGYLLERRYGDGGLIACALELDQSLPEARYLLGAMVRHATSRSFRPKTPLSDDALNRLRAAAGL